MDTSRSERWLNRPPVFYMYNELKMTTHIVVLFTLQIKVILLFLSLEIITLLI